MGVIGELCEDNSVDVILNYLTVADNVGWKSTDNKCPKLKNVNCEQNESICQDRKFWGRMGEFRFGTG